jgi:hypothetical protein
MVAIEFFGVQVQTELVVEADGEAIEGEVDRGLPKVGVGIREHVLDFDDHELKSGLVEAFFVAIIHFNNYICISRLMNPDWISR